MASSEGELGDIPDRTKNVYKYVQRYKHVNELRKMMDDRKEDFSTETEIMKKNQPEMLEVKIQEVNKKLEGCSNSGHRSLL